MKKASFVFLAIGLVLMTLGMTACSHSIIAKDCKPVEDGELSICKNLKPWE